MLRAIISAVLLILAFPKTDLWLLAWIALIPLMKSLDGRRPLKAFGTAFLCGWIFFAGTLYWFIHVTILGAVILISYLAVYFGFWGLGYSYFRDKKPFVRVVFLSALWAVLEFIRAHLFTGFDWGSLGYSQYKNLTVIQMADVTGVLGVSFLIVWVNVVLKECLGDFKKGISREVIYFLLFTLGFLSLIVGYGVFRLKETYAGPSIKIAVVQGNINQEMKWEEMFWPEVMSKHIRLTRQASLDNPDLIIWPETAYPGILEEEDLSSSREDLFESLKGLVRNTRIPLLAGTVIQEKGSYFNSAVLLSPEAQTLQRYDKIHLVPFGEYVPLRFLFPFLSRIVPIADFTAGKEYTLFSLPSQNPPFSVLICFEDTIARLSRQFVLAGSQLLVNITNDGWFQDTKAPFMHLQGAVFRAVENRRSLVRCANTGVSCFINPQGKILNQAEDKNHKMTYVSGCRTEEVPFNSKISFYTRFGDVWIYFCIGFIGWIILKKN